MTDIHVLVCLEVQNSKTLDDHYYSLRSRRLVQAGEERALFATQAIIIIIPLRPRKFSSWQQNPKIKLPAQ